MSSSATAGTMPMGNQNYGYQSYFPSNFVRSKIQEFAQGADKFANQFFAPAETGYTSSRSHKEVHHHHYHRYSPFYSPWYEPSFIVFPSSPSRSTSSRRKDDDESATKLLGIVATVGALVATYTIGLSWSALNEANEELDQTKQFEKNLSLMQQGASPEDQVLLAETKEAVSLKGKICERITNSVAWDLRLRLAVAAGLAMTGYGALLTPTIAPAIQSGVALTVVSLAAMLFKAGSDSVGNANIRDAQQLKSTLKNINTLIKE